MFISPLKPLRFNFLRCITGIYFASVFFHYSLHTKIIFSEEFVFTRFPTPFPSIVQYFGNSHYLLFMICLLIITSLLFCFDFIPRTSAIIIWLGWACISNLFSYFTVPSDGFMGWLILATAFMPMSDKKDTISDFAYWGTTLVLGVSYFASGINKLSSPSWLNGDAILYIAENPVAYVYISKLTPFFHTVPIIITKSLTWLILAIEILFLPLFFFSKTRKWIWGLATLWHIGALITVYLPFVSVGMIIFHFYLFDLNWFSKKDKD